MNVFLVSAFILGFAGSLHCAGMCGPLALAIPLNNKSWLSRITGVILYNTGRIITYALIGALFGIIGAGLSFSGIQRWITIAAGVVMILSILIPILFRKAFSKNNFLLINIVKKKLSELFRLKTYKSLFFIGILNGLLPCGLVYVAIAGAIASADVLQAVLFMIFFGIATLPMLAIITLAGNIITVKIRMKMQKFIPYVVIIIGLLFILRGLNLGIPYISPAEKKLHPPVKIENKEKHNCCKNE